MRTLLFVLAIISSSLHAGTVKIGAVLPLIGDAASFGEPMREGLLMKMAEIEKDNTLLNNYKLIIEEGGYDMKSALMATQRQIDINKADAILSFGGEYSKVIAPLAKRNKLYHIGVSGSPTEVSDAKYNFSFISHPNLLAESLAAYIKQSGYSRPYMLTMRINSTISLSQEIPIALEKEGIKPLGENFVNPGEHDFRVTLQKVIQHEPDILIINYKSPEQDILLRQLNQLYPGTPVTSIAFFDDIEHPAEILEGVTYVALGYPSAQFNQQVIDQGLQPRSYQANLYAMLQIMVNAFEATAKGDVTDPGEYLRSLENYPTVLGPITTASDGVIDIEPALVKVENGKRVKN